MVKKSRVVLQNDVRNNMMYAITVQVNRLLLVDACIVILGRGLCHFVLVQQWHLSEE